MDDKLSAEAEKRIRALCRKISVAHNLDEEIQAELYSHMEDKLFGYLSGEEKLTEEDAFILVREHFGDPAVIKGMFQEAHSLQSTTSLARRLGAVATASLGISCVVQLLVMFCGMYLSAREEMRKPVTEIIPVLDMVFMALPFLLLWSVLLVWKKGIDRGRKMWFYRVGRNVFLLYMLIFLLFFLLEYSLFFGRSSHNGNWDLLQHYFIPLLLQCPLWLWWCDRSPRQYRALLAGALAWAGYCILIGVIWSVSVGDYMIMNPFITASLYFLFAFAALCVMGIYIALSNVHSIRQWFEGEVARE
jgi:uncharacterized membrane protein YozB (DUF420 family)